VIIVGSGKSVTTAAAIDDILSRPRSNNDHIALFFCEYDRDDSLTASNILACLIRQCLCPDKISTEILDQLQSLVDGRSPDTDELLVFLNAIAASSSSVTLVVDGFDECAEAEKLLILKELHRLMSSAQSIIKIFLSSRESEIEGISKIFKTFRQLSMRCEEAGRDIATYIRETIEEKTEQRDLVVGDSELVGEIRNALLEGADGMFLWVALQVNLVCRQKSDADIRKTIAALPKGLTATYERIVDHIIEDGESATVKKIVQFVAAAKRPLLLHELREAIAIDPGDKLLAKDRLVNDMESMIARCCDLVTLDDEDMLVQFPHHSVKQFLLSDPSKPLLFRLSDADMLFGEICVTYLNFADFQQQMVEYEKASDYVQGGEIISEVASLAIGRQMGLAKFMKKIARARRKRRSVQFDINKQLNDLFVKDNGLSSNCMEEGYLLLPYTRKYWALHTAAFTEENEVLWSLWKRLALTDHPLATKPWETVARDSLEGSIADFIVNNSHHALLNALMSGKYYVRRPVDIDSIICQVAETGDTRFVNTSVVSAVLFGRKCDLDEHGGHLKEFLANRKS